MNDYIFYFRLRASLAGNRSYNTLSSLYRSPQQIKRELLITADRGLAKYFDAVRVIREKLLQLRIPKEWVNMTDYVHSRPRQCSVAKMLMPKLNRCCRDYYRGHDRSIQPPFEFRWTEASRCQTVHSFVIFCQLQHRITWPPMIIRKKAFSKVKPSPTEGSGGAKQCSLSRRPCNLRQSFRQWTAVVLQEADLRIR